MRQICSLEEYGLLTKGIRFKNNGFRLEQVKEYIQRGCLYYDETSSRRMLIYVEHKYSQLVISKPLSDKEDTIIPKIFREDQSKPIVCYLVGDFSDKNLLENWGFEYICASEKYTLEIVNVSIQLELNQLSDPLQLYYQTNSWDEIEQIKRLWEDNLPVVEVPILSDEEFRQLEDKEQLLYMKDEVTNQIVAACYYDLFMGTSTIHHIVVHKEYRNRHIASHLLIVWLNKLKQMKVRKAVSWIEEENHASRVTFEKLGFDKSDTESLQFILTGGL